MPDSNETPEFYSTVPISVPIVVPEAEDVHLNGFVWSHRFGILLGYGRQGDPGVDELSRLREVGTASEDFGTDFDSDNRSIRGIE